MKAHVGIGSVPTGNMQGLLLPFLKLGGEGDIELIEAVSTTTHLIIENNLVNYVVVDSTEEAGDVQEVLAFLRSLAKERVLPFFIHKGVDVPLYVWGGYRILFVPGDSQAVVEEAHWMWSGKGPLPEIPHAQRRYVHVASGKEAATAIKAMKEAKVPWYITSDKFLLRILP